MIHPDLMRRLDRWIGIPLCWSLTQLRRAKALLSGGRAAGTLPAPRRTAFILLSECGSMVLADPAVRALADDENSKAFFVTFAQNRPALAITGTVPDDRIFSFRIDRPLTLLRDVWRWRRWLRAHRIDAVVDFELFSCLSAALCALSGVRRRAGFHAAAGGIGLYRGDLYSHQAAYDPLRHIAHNYLALADAVLDRPSSTSPDLPQPVRRVLHASETAVVRALLSSVLPAAGGRSRLLLVNPNASEFLPQRRWPVPHFVALICRLLDRHADLQVLLIGGPGDAGTTEMIAEAVADARCADIAGRLALPELPALFAVADALLSNDSGPAHFAAVAGLPVVVLFGPETPALYRPLGRATAISANLPCSPCVNVTNQRKTRCEDNRCMRAISVDAVIGAVEAVFASPVCGGNVVTMPARVPAEAPGAQRSRA